MNSESSASSPLSSSESGRTSIQAVPPPPESSALQGLTPPASPPAKTKRKRMTVEGLTRLVGRLDKVIVGVVVLLTFLLGSFTARNSDLWQHLATGRAIAQQGSFLRQDPFTYTADGTWVNHSWLSDLILYNVFRLTAGADSLNPDLSRAGPLLVGAKALLIVLLAWVMMRIRRPGQSIWAAAVCTALSIVVLSRWTFLQPKCISFLFLGLTLYLLQRPEPEPGANKFSLGRSIFAVPILFALWVNLDEWFILGPITVGLFLVGQLIQQFLFPVRTGEDVPLPGRLGRQALLLIAGLAACLLNPYFYHAFQIPSELWIRLTDSPLLLDEDIARSLRVPFSADSLKSAFGPNPSSSEIGYHVLAALGLVSFVLNWAQWRGWRTLIWLAFYALSAYQERMISFFAVVAGPITALNLQDFAARRYGLDYRIENPWKTVSLAGRLATLTVGILLVVAAWPGMLHGHYEDPIRTHHVSWQLEPDPSLRQAAVKMRELRLTGVIGDGNGFNFTPEIADYFAWFCPEEKSFFDRRYLLFSKVADSYVDMRSALGPFKEKVQTWADYYQKEGQLQQTLKKEMSQNHINHLIVSGLSFEGIRPAAVRLWADPAHWTVLYMDGRTAIFGWSPPRTPASEIRFPAQAFRAAPWAFGPAIPESARAPMEAPHMEDSPTDLQQWWSGPSPRSLDTDASTMLVAYSQALRSRSEIYAGANHAAWQVMSLSGPVSAACTGHYYPQARLAMMLIPDNLLKYDRRLEPAATALLAVRAGRRAVKDNPQDYFAYLELAYAIQFLSDVDEVSEGSLGRIRQIQRVAALHKALILKPKSIDVHSALSQAYLQMDLRPLQLPPLDLAIEHLNQIVEIRAAEGRKGKQTEEEFQKEIEQHKLKLKNLREQTGLDRKQTDYESGKRRHSSLARKATDAVQHGLFQEAIQVLIDAEGLGDRGPDGDLLLLQLWIWTGQLDEARAFLLVASEPTAESGDTKIKDPQLEFQITAGTGDYAKADAALAQLIQRQEEAGTKRLMMLVRDSTWARSIGRDGPLGMGAEMLMGFIVSSSFLRDLADTWTMRGVLALEYGDSAKAEEYFDRALRVVQNPPEQRPSFTQQGIAYRYHHLLKRAKEEAREKSP